MRPLPPATPRTLELPLDSSKIVALVGIRRSGKTFLLYETMRPRILKEYVDLVFYRDLVERYGVGNPQLMRLLLRQCLGHPASLFNVH